MGLEGVTQGLAPVLGLAHNLKVGLGFQQAFEPLAKKGVIVGEQDANHYQVLYMAARCSLEK